MAIREIDVADLRVGDRIDVQTYGAIVRVLREGEPSRDRFGRDMVRFWCRGESGEVEGREGFMTYGPGARVKLMPR